MGELMHGTPSTAPVARALDIIGDTWTILMLRDLFLDGPRKFQDFQESLSRVSPNTLSARLKKLEANGIIKRRFYEQHPPRAEYVLTEGKWGPGILPRTGQPEVGRICPQKIIQVLPNDGAEHARLGVAGLVRAFGTTHAPA